MESLPPVDPEWLDLRYAIMDLLQKEQRLLQVVKLVGPDVLPQTQRLVLEVCNIFKNTFLQQMAFDPVDTYSSARKQFLMLKVIMKFYQAGDDLVKKGINVQEIKEAPVYQEILRMRYAYPEDKLDALADFPKRIEDSLKGMSF